MKDHLKYFVEKAVADQKQNLVREYLQAKTLQFLMEKKKFLSWVFHGGTALRFLFDLPRFSEDLDFSLIQSGDVTFEDTADGVVRAFQAEGYDADLKYSGKLPIEAVFIRFKGLLAELGLSPHAREILSIKIELDTNPPFGGLTETTIIRRHLLLNLFHFDRSTLLAGKLNAILTRPYFKGRDLFDLFWYLADPNWPQPNLGYLNQALRQTDASHQNLTAKTWPEVIASRLADVDWKVALADVRPFIENPMELELLTPQNLQALLSRKQKNSKSKG